MILWKGLCCCRCPSRHKNIALLLGDACAAPMLDALAAGFKECKLKPIVGPKLQLDGFLDGMLRSRISRRIMAEQHICLAASRPGFIGIICADLSLPDAVRFAAQRTKQVTARPTCTASTL